MSRWLGGAAFVFCAGLAGVPVAAVAMPVPVDVSQRPPVPFGAAGGDGPAVAVDSAAGSRLIVWADGDGQAPQDNRIVARLVDRAGRPLGVAGQVSDPAAPGVRVGAPAVAFDPVRRHYVVAWRAYGDFGHLAQPSQILIRRLDATGVPLDSADVPVGGPSAPDLRASLGADPVIVRDDRTGAYLVAWDAPTPAGSAVLVHALSPEGVPAGPTGMLAELTGHGLGVGRPAASYDRRTRRYLVAWTQTAFSPDRGRVFARSLDEHGHLGPTRALYRTRDRIASAPALARSAHGALLSWVGAGVDGAFSSVLVRPLDPWGRPTGPIRAVSSGYYSSSPTVLFDPGLDTYLVGWLSQPELDAGPHCSSSISILTRAVTVGGAPAGRARDARADMPGPVVGGDDPTCRPIGIYALVGIPRATADPLLIWSGSIAGQPREVWTRPLGLAQSPSAPRVRGKPVLTFDRKHPRQALTAYVRFDRRLPRFATGALRISLAGPNQEFAPGAAVGHLSRACYAAGLTPVSRPRTGLRLRLRIDVGPPDGFKRYLFTVRLRGLDHEPTRQHDNRVLQELGCVDGR